MARNSPISIRLEPETQRELERMSSETGIPMSSLARMAIEAALTAFRKTGGYIEVPLRFEVVTSGGNPISAKADIGQGSEPALAGPDEKQGGP